MAGWQGPGSRRHSGIAHANRGRWSRLGILTILLSFGLLAPKNLVADGNLVWVRAMGGTDFAFGVAITVDPAGNSYTTGWFKGTVDFDPGPDAFNITSSGFEEAFVSKLDANGDFVWARTMGGTGDSAGSGIAVDAVGNVYTTGSFEGTAHFGPIQLTSAGSRDIFVSKLDSNGNVLWARAMGGTGFDVGSGIALDGAGNVYATGAFQGTVDFDPGPASFNVTSAGSSDIFVTKLVANGDFAWTRTVGGANNDLSNGIALDGAGNIYFTGSFEDTVDFDPGPNTFHLSPAGGKDIFVSKLGANGDFIWAGAMGGTGQEASLGIAVDGAGSVYTTGVFEDTADFDPSAQSFNLTSAGREDIFVSKLDANGDFLWARAMGGASDDRGFGIAVDETGSVYTSGYFRETVDFDPGPDSFPLTSISHTDIFLSMLDPDGNFVWARAMGGTGLDFGTGVDVDAGRSVYSTGRFAGTAFFDGVSGSFNLTAAGNSDLFVLKLSATDITPPKAIAITPATTGPTKATAVEFTVTFDEEVAYFDDAADLIITHNGTAHIGASITGGPEVYTVAITGISGDGWFTVAVSTLNDVEDLAGNPLSSSVTSVPVVIDSTLPAAAPFLAVLAMLFAAVFVFRIRIKTETAKRSN